MSQRGRRHSRHAYSDSDSNDEHYIRIDVRDTEHHRERRRGSREHAHVSNTFLGVPDGGRRRATSTGGQAQPNIINFNVPDRSPSRDRSRHRPRPHQASSSSSSSRSRSRHRRHSGYYDRDAIETERLRRQLEEARLNERLLRERERERERERDRSHDRDAWKYEEERRQRSEERRKERYLREAEEKREKERRETDRILREAKEKEEKKKKEDELKRQQILKEEEEKRAKEKKKKELEDRLFQERVKLKFMEAGRHTRPTYYREYDYYDYYPRRYRY